jgi:hypothetical protein
MKDVQALKREHPAFQNMKCINFFLFLWVIFALLDPDPDPDSEFGYGSADLVPKHWSTMIKITLYIPAAVQQRRLCIGLP